MYRENCIKIKNNENENTIKIIGKIDINAIEHFSIETLYYIFPLIERIVVEIYKLLPLKDVEQYSQGYMRTIISILNKDNNNIFSQKTIDLLNKYYGENGLRNKLLHGHDDIGHITITANELDYFELLGILEELLIVLKDTCSKYTIDTLGKIKELA